MESYLVFVILPVKIAITSVKREKFEDETKFAARYR